METAEYIATYSGLRERMKELSGVVMVIGDIDTGKTSLSKLLIGDAVGAGRSVAYVDADVAVSTVGPAACVGLKLINTLDDLANLGEPDALRFVGSTEPNSVVLAHVVAVASMVTAARQSADLIVIDTTGVVSGVVGQTLKYHLAELTEPALVVAMQRGNELDPIISMLRRFFGLRIAEVAPIPDLIPRSPVERAQMRASSFHRELGDDPQRWRIQTTVFAPTLPAGFDVERLDGMLVGVQDEHGGCLGLGVLEQSQGTVKVATRHGDAMRGLRLGSIRMDLETFATTRVRLRELILGV
ncbi:MAG: Clp1/GlmU family protein [Acidimicrobiia bacterium]|nr:Clp1/GlmU family protein [Acidimicrobiia bacterium]